MEAHMVIEIVAVALTLLTLLAAAVAGYWKMITMGKNSEIALSTIAKTVDEKFSNISHEIEDLKEIVVQHTGDAGRSIHRDPDLEKERWVELLANFASFRKDIMERFTAMEQRCWAVQQLEKAGTRIKRRKCAMGSKR